jgi:hypothetical protein
MASLLHHPYFEFAVMAEIRELRSHTQRAKLANPEKLTIPTELPTKSVGGSVDKLFA